MSKLTWIVAAFIVVFVLARMRPTTESFDPQQAVTEVTSGEVRAAPKSIKNIALTGLTTRAPQRANPLSRLFKGSPAYSIIVRARPKYVLTNGVVVVGKSFTVQGFGESRESATSNAYKKASQAQTSYMNALRTAGLLQIG